MKLTSFEKKVFEAVALVPFGRVVTYKNIAVFLGKPNSGRAVGNALNKNSDINKISCFRVVKNNGEVGGFVLGVEKKIELLQREGVEIKNNRIKNFDKILYSFP